MQYAVPKRRPLTIREYARLPETDGRVDLVRGIAVREPPAGGEHGSLQVTLASALHVHVRSHGLGRVLSDASFIISEEPPIVRAPDVAFVAKGRYPADEVPATMTGFAPDLAVEIVSPTDRAADLHEKVHDYLAAGTRQVWVVHPRTREVLVFRADGMVTRLTEADVLTAEDVVPGFAIAVRDATRP